MSAALDEIVSRIDEADGTYSKKEYDNMYFEWLG